MRMLMTVSIPTEAGNAAIRSGKLMAVIQSTLAELKPEAAYFTTDDEGNRCGTLVFDLKEPSDIPAIAEPLFMGLNAQVTLRPAMTAQDLATARPALEKAAKEG